MASAAQSLALTAPLTGTLRYPLASLIDLGRLILIDYQSHLKAQETVANTADNDDAMWEATDSLGARRWKEEQEKAKGGSFPEYIGNPKEMEALNDPKQTEKSLFIMGANHKDEYVIHDAIKLRREKRSDPPEGRLEERGCVTGFFGVHLEE